MILEIPGTPFMFKENLLHKAYQNKKIIFPLLLIPVGSLIYYNLQWLVDYLVFELLGLDEDLSFTSAFRFFAFQLPKVFLLLAFIIFFVGIIRSYFSPERTRKTLEGKSLFTGNILASLLGVVTPFCSCFAVPLFIGFVEAGIPLGVTFSFLIAAPMINEVAIVLLLGLFGIKIALIYTLTGLCIAIISGWILGKLNPVKWVEPWVYQIRINEQKFGEEGMNLAQRIKFGIDASGEIIKKVWVYIIAGITVGALVHGYVQDNIMVSVMGNNNWYSVPLSVLIGIPLYASAGGIIPVISVLLEKGVSLGTALAFSMSVIGLSLPEIIILKKVLKLQMLGVFVGIVAGGIIIMGYLFNFMLQ